MRPTPKTSYYLRVVREQGRYVWRLVDQRDRMIAEGPPRSSRQLAEEEAVELFPEVPIQEAMFA
jgi:hypothetical protein